MAVTTVSPSPTSSTEGDELCEIHVTSVAIDCVTLLICLCGLVWNGAVLRHLSMEDRNTSIFDLAFADFLLLIFTGPSALLLLVEDMSCSPIIPLMYMSFLFQLSLVSCYWSMFRLTRSRNIVNMYKLCSNRNIPERLLRLVDSVQYWAIFALFIVTHAVTNLCPSHQQEHCQAFLISMHILILVLCAAPVVISITIKFIKAKWCPKKQPPKRRDIIIFLLVLFILLLSLCNVLQQYRYIIVSSQVVFLLNCIHSSLKPFIYFLAGGFQRPCSVRSLQLSLQRVFDEQEEAVAHSSDVVMDTGV